MSGRSSLRLPVSGTPGTLALCLLLALALVPLPSAARNEACIGGNFVCDTDNDCPIDCDSKHWNCLNETINVNKTQLLCKHKDLFDPFLAEDAGLAIVLFVFLALAAVGGIGGGGLLIPMLLLITEFPAYTAVPLSVTAIAGGAIVSFIILVRLHHPDPVVAHRPMIDFPIILLLLPMALAGTVIGVMLNAVSPKWLIIGIIFFVLTYVTFRTFRKGMFYYRQEVAEIRAQHLAEKERQSGDIALANGEPMDTANGNGHVAHTNGDTGKSNGNGTSTFGDAGSDSAGTPLHYGDTTMETSFDADNNETATTVKSLGGDGATNGSANGTDMNSTAETSAIDMLINEMDRTPEQEEELRAIIARESEFPLKFILITFGILGVVVVLAVLRGGKDDSLSGVECGQAGYFGITAAMFVFLISASALAGKWIFTRYERMVAVKYPFVVGDVKYDRATIIKYPIYAIAVGFLAGFLGIGGGMVLGPMLLALGLVPIVSASTTSYMTLFTSSSSTIQFITFGRVPLDYGIMVFLVAMLASLVGQLSVLTFVRRNKRNSIIIFVLAAVIGIATILLLVTGIIDIKEDYDEGKSFGFTALC